MSPTRSQNGLAQIQALRQMSSSKHGMQRAAVKQPIKEGVTSEEAGAPVGMLQHAMKEPNISREVESTRLELEKPTRAVVGFAQILSEYTDLTA